MEAAGRGKTLCLIGLQARVESLELRGRRSLNRNTGWGGRNSVKELTSLAHYSGGVGGAGSNPVGF